MRRAPAILLLLGFSIALMPPVYSEEKLPACCRRDGKHHCSMGKDARESGVSLKGTPARCPLYPTGKAVPATGKAGVPAPTFVLLAPVWSGPAAIERTEARARVSFSRAWQERGPPSENPSLPQMNAD